MKRAIDVHLQRCLRRFGLLVCGPVCLSVSLSLSLAARGAQAQPVASVSEYNMKAAFVFNFAVFTEWPAEVLAPGAAMTLCSYAGNELLPSLSSLNDKVVNGHRIVVKTLAAQAGVSACHILVFDGTERKLWSPTRRTIGGASMLTVSNEPGGEDDGAVISLTVENSRIGFAIDLAAARQARLVLSSKLLRLARSAK